MSWKIKTLLFLVILLLILGTAGMIYLIRARMQGTEYQFQVDAVLAAARAANGGEALTDPDRAVIASWEGRRAVISPGNYQALSSYLRREAAMPLLARMDPEGALKIVCCREAELLARPADETGDRVLVRLTTQGQTFTMHIKGGNLWQNLLACCTEGTYHDRNLPLDQ